MKERFHEMRKRAQFIRNVLNNNIDDDDGGRSAGLCSTASHVDIPTVFGRDIDKDKIISMLLADTDTDTGGYHRGESSNGVAIIRIVGMTGVGKTTLAQIVYNDHRLKRHFDIQAWVCVHHDFDHSRILREMMMMLSDQYPRAHSSQNQLYEDFLSIVRGKRVLLVLDGVRTVNNINEDWKKLLYLLNTGTEGRSSVLVTSQRSDVCGAIEMEMGMGIQHSTSSHTLELDPLNDDSSWDLFLQSAFPLGECPLELESFAREIVGKCKGLPFVLKAMGSVFMNNQLLDRRSWRKISQLGLCEVERMCRSFEIKPNILPMLKVSYNHLPSCIKPLFSYLSLFPKGYLINKKELAQFWIAESLIQSQAGQQETMVETASQHFDHLLTRSFFHKRTSRSFRARISTDDGQDDQDDQDDGQGDQNDDSDDYNNDNSDHYMMHDLYHELARSISTPYCCQVEGEEIHPQYYFSDKTRHISVTCKDNDVDVEKIVLEIIEKCKKVRTLLFPFPYHNNLRKVEFGQSLDQLFNSMKYMRVLDLSSSTIRELPKSVKRLKLLRYLNLSNTDIKTLPHSICKLFYLQTLKLLKCPRFSELPRNLAKLINLRHLELDEDFWFKPDFKLPPRIGSLTNLQTLSRFPIRRDQVGHGIEELKGMSYLTGSLHISNLENAVNAKEAKLDMKEMLDKLVLEWSSNNIGDDAVKVLEDLMPHSDLKELQILHFGGSKFPHWMTDHGQLIQLQNLVTVSLEYCTRCTTLSLGGLLYLKKLYIKEMQELKELIYDQESENYVLSLALLEISNCPRVKVLPSGFPNLEDLKIKGCDSLKALPVTPVLKVLVLVDNLVLEDLNEEHDYFSSRLELKISGCPKVKALPHLFTSEKVQLGGCNLLLALPSLDFPQLEHLVLDESSDKILEMGTIPEITSLKSLVISNISTASTFPRWPRLPALKALYIRNGKDLVALPDEGLPTTLECLTLCFCPNLQSLGPTDVLKNTYLKDLYIEDCPKLHSLPKGGVSISLQHLVIKGCPILEERCRDYPGSDWPKIMHVPHRYIGSSLHPSNQVLQGHSKASSSTPPGHRLTMPPQKG